MFTKDKPQPEYTSFMRGGRMVKFKGIAASVAPMVGAAVLFTGLSASLVLAADECGTEAAGPDTITCAASEYSSGISYTNSDGLGLTLDNPAMAIAGTGVTVSSDTVTGDAISVTGANFDTITTVGTNTESNNAISVNLATGYTGGASIILSEEAGTITTTGRSAGAIIASSTSGPGDLLIEMHGGAITTDGFQANALQIFQSPTNGPWPIAQVPPGAANATGDLTIRMTGGTILAQGDSSDGLTINNRGLGDSLVEITGGSIEANVTESLNVANPSFSGVFANGVALYNINTAASNFAEVRMSGGSIDVDGPNSNGILLQNSGTGDSRITVTNDAVVNVAGTDSSGIFIRNGFFLTEGTPRAGTFEVLVDGTAVVTGGSGAGSGILVGEPEPAIPYDGPPIASVSGTIEIGAGATVDGSASGVAIRDVDFSSLYEGNNTTMIIRGTLLGDILAGQGDDSVRIADDADIADVDLIDGGGSQADEITFSNWSGSDPASRADETIIDIDGALIANMEEVFLLNGSDVTFGGTTLSNASDNGLLFEVEEGSTARFANDFEIDGDVNNFGALDLSAPNLAVGTALTVTGNYAAASDLFVDFDLSTGGGTDNLAANDAALTDQLFIAGNVTGTTDVFVNDIGGAWLSTDLNENGLVDNNEGLLFAQVTGTAAADSFVLDAPAVQGAFALGIFGFDPDSSASGLWDFVLGLTYSGSVPVYEAFPLALQGLQPMPSLQQRVGNRHWAGQPTAVAATSETVFCKDPAQNFSCAVTPDQAQVFADAPDGTVIEGAGVWVRVDGSRSDFTPVSTNAGISVDETVSGIEAGIDHQIFENDAGDRLIGGISLRYAQSGVDVFSDVGDGTIDTSGFGLGAALTWYDTEGLYVDAQARAMWTSSDFGSSAFGPLAEGVEGFGYGLSVEVGKEFAVSDTWNLTPQAQLAYTNVAADDFTGPFATVTDIAAESLTMRAGVVASNEADWEADNGTTSRRALNVGFHVTKALLSESLVVVSGTALQSEKDDTMGEITLGGTYSWNDEKYSLYGQVSAATGLNSFGDNNRIGATAGVRIQW